MTELEDAINYWRSLRPSSGEARALSPEVKILATCYALMIFNRQTSISVDRLNPACLDLLTAWREKKPA